MHTSNAMHRHSKTHRICLAPTCTSQTHLLFTSLQGFKTPPPMPTHFPPPFLPSPTCVARNSCCFLPMSVSNTFCSRMSLVPTSLQSMPR